jgi:MFS family permease
VNASSRRIQRIYLLLLLLHTLAASFIWGINTLFLLDAGLSNTEAFAANAFFTAGQVLFEVPTGVVADTRGRRTSYLLGTLTLAVSTLIYLVMWRISAPFWAWAVTSAFIGLGFTFFSGAVEAWLVDALAFRGYFREGGKLETVFGKGQIVEGVAMLGGSVAGGVVAQATNLGVPYVLRAVVILITFVAAFALMRDVGFTPSRGQGPVAAIKVVLRGSIEQGLANRPVRWVMLAAPFVQGVTLYGFYAMQPYLLELYGDKKAYAIAGISASLVAGAQIVGGLIVPYAGRIFRRRTSVLLVGTALGTIMIAIIGVWPRFWVAVPVLAVWALTFAALTPARQAYLNGLIASSQRATVLSFDSLLGSSGGVVIQPILGRAADVWSYPASYVCGAAIQAIALPFLWLARRERASADVILAVESAASSPEGEARRLTSS